MVATTAGGRVLKPASHPGATHGATKDRDEGGVSKKGRPSSEELVNRFRL